MEDGTYSSTIYTFPNPEKAVGAYKQENPMAHLSPSDLTLLTGCAIILNYEKGMFVGATKEGECLNKWGEAAYATSEVKITKKTLLSWDRGWNNSQEQVWGAVRGGYLFEKIKK